MELHVTQNAEGEPDLNASTLLEQYKLYVQMADKVSDRRAEANKFFISLLTGLLALLSVVVGLKITSAIQSSVLLVVAILGVLLCYVWFVTIRSYGQLNSGKFKVIYEVEKRLAFRFYEREWELLGRGKDKRLYRPLTRVERYVPQLFAIPYTLLLVAALYLLATSV
jgi:hypothetical protein